MYCKNCRKEVIVSEEEMRELQECARRLFEVFSKNFPTTDRYNANNPLVLFDQMADCCKKPDIYWSSQKEASVVVF